MEDLKAIRVFLAVADGLSFAGAARQLNLTPASITRIVAKLEEDLGQQLLIRTTRQVSLTSAGALVAARYRPILEEFDRATREVTHSYRPDLGRLRINAPLSMGMRLMPGVIDAFRLAYPRIAIDLRLTDALIDIIEEPCDLAIRVSGPPEDKSTIWRKLCEVPRHAVAAPSLFLRTPAPDRPEDLDPALCLSYSADGNAETWTFRKSGQRRIVKAGTDLTANNGDVLCDLAERGVGIAVLPAFITTDALNRGTLIPVLPDWDLTSLWLTLFYPPYARLPPLVATFSEFFEAYIRNLDGLDFGTA